MNELQVKFDRKNKAFGLSFTILVESCKVEFTWKKNRKKKDNNKDKRTWI